MKNKAVPFFFIVGIIFMVGTILAFINLSSVKGTIPTEVWWAIVERLCLTICFFVLAAVFKKDIDEAEKKANGENTTEDANSHISEGVSEEHEAKNISDEVAEK